MKKLPKSLFARSSGDWNGVGSPSTHDTTINFPFPVRRKWMTCQFGEYFLKRRPSRNHKVRSGTLKISSGCYDNLEQFNAKWHNCLHFCSLKISRLHLFVFISRKIFPILLAEFILKIQSPGNSNLSCWLCEVPPMGRAEGGGGGILISPFLSKVSSHHQHHPWRHPRLLLERMN